MLRNFSELDNQQRVEYVYSNKKYNKDKSTQKKKKGRNKTKQIVKLEKEITELQTLVAKQTK